MNTIGIVRTFLVITVAILSSYVLIMDEKRIFINNNVNSACTNKWGYLVLATFILSIIFLSAGSLVSWGLNSALEKTGVNSKKPGK